jgi:hypothetical protein
VGLDSRDVLPLMPQIQAEKMRRSGVYRLFTVINRCLLGGWLLVSFTASASVDATRGFSIASYHAPRPALTNNTGISTDSVDDLLIIVPNHMGLGPEFLPDSSTSPRFQAKFGIEEEPKVNTRAKSDPFPAFVAGFGGETPINYADTWVGTPKSSASVVPLLEQDGKAARSSSNSLTPKAVSTGSTPTVSGADTMTIALILNDFSKSMIAKNKHQTSPFNPALLAGPVSDKEMRCLTEAVYFEARSEPERGQAAVAQVVLNRLKSIYYPTTICDIVYQNQERYLGCEFTFTCEGKSLAVNDPTSWITATRLARQVLDGAIYNTEVGDSTHYHADYVRPYWAKALDKRDIIGRHIFYSLKPGLPGGICPGCLLTKAAG